MTYNRSLFFAPKLREPLIDRRDREGSPDKAVIVNDRQDFLALLVFVAGIPKTIPSFFSDRFLGRAVRFCLTQGNRQEAETGTQSRTALLLGRAAEFD